MLVALNDVQLSYNAVRDANTDTLALAWPHGGGFATAVWDTRDTPSLADGEWHQIAYTFDAATGTVKVYLDGAAVAGNTGVDVLGGNAGTPLSTDFTGQVDELAVYPTPLSLSRIAAHYIAAFSGDAGAGDAGLVVHLGHEGAGLTISAVGKGGRLWRATAASTGDAVFLSLDRGSTVTVSVSGVDTWRDLPVIPVKVALSDAVSELDLPVTARPTTTLTGRATLTGDGSPVAGAQVAVVQSAGGGSQTLYGTTDDEGRYAVTGLRTGDDVTTTASIVSAQARGTAGTLDLGAGQTHDFSLVPLLIYHLQLHLFTQLPGQPAQEQPDTARTQVHFSEYLLSTNSTYGLPPADSDVAGYAGDEVSFCADGGQAGLDRGCATATLPGSTADPIVLNLTLHGAQQVSFVARRDDGSASAVEVTGVEEDNGLQTVSTRIPTGPDDAGQALTLAVPEPGTWDFSFTSDTFKATRTGVVVAADDVTPLGTVHLSDSGVFGGADNTVLATRQQVAPGGMLDVTAKWHASAAAANATLHVDVPSGTTLPANGFVVNGAVVAAVVASDNTVSAPLGDLAEDAAGTATLHLQLGAGASAPPAGTLPVRATIGYDGGQGLVGAATADVAGVSLDGPSQTGVSAIAVHGHAQPGSLVTVREGGLVIGQVTTPASGYWHSTVGLPDRGQHYVHVLRATTPIEDGHPDGDAYRSDDLDVTYDRFVPTLGDVTLSQDVDEGATVTAPAGSSFPYVVVPGAPIAVDTHITNPERVTNASIELAGQAYPATVSPGGTLHAVADSHGYPSGPITLEYDEGPSSASFVDQAGPPPDSLEQARLRLPPGSSGLVGDPVADPHNTDTDMTFTSAVGAPDQPVMASITVGEASSPALGEPVAGGLWLALDGISVAKESGQRRVRVHAPIHRG